MKIKGLIMGLMICSLCSAQETAAPSQRRRLSRTSPTPSAVESVAPHVRRGGALSHRRP